MKPRIRLCFRQTSTTVEVSVPSSSSSSSSPSLFRVSSSLSSSASSTMKFKVRLLAPIVCGETFERLGGLADGPWRWKAFKRHYAPLQWTVHNWPAEFCRIDRQTVTLIFHCVPRVLYLQLHVNVIHFEKWEHSVLLRWVITSDCIIVILHYALSLMVTLDYVGWQYWS